MAIHIDIIAHLRKRDLIREGEELKRYINSLERDVTKTMTEGARGRTAQITRLIDTQAAGYNDLINKADAATAARKREAAAEAEIARISQWSERTKASRTKKTKALTKAENEYRDALMDRVYAEQQLDKSSRTHQRNVRAVTDAEAAYAKRAREVSNLIRRTSEDFHRLSIETNRERREVDDLNSALAVLGKQGALSAKSLDKMSDATRKRIADEEKLKRMYQENTATYEQIEAQAQRTYISREAERRAIRDTATGLRDEVNKRLDLTNVIEDNRSSMQGLTNEAARYRRELMDLARHEERHLRNNKQAAGAYDRARAAMHSSNIEFDRLNRMISGGTATREQIIRQIENTRRAFDREGSAVRTATRAMRELFQATNEVGRLRQVNDVLRDMVSAAGRWGARNLGALTPLGIVTPTLVIPLVTIFSELAKSITTASQALWLVPAAAAAAGAGLATLQMGLLGISDTWGALTDLMASYDPRKPFIEGKPWNQFDVGKWNEFSNQLGLLGDNAAQAMLAIRDLLGPIKELQKAVQNVMFADVAQMIDTFYARLGPHLEAMFVGIGGAFNSMLRGAFDELMTPTGTGNFKNILQNIADAFVALGPAARSFTQAILDITSAGSDVLPSLAESVTVLAKEFADFIREAKKSGDLRKWMDMGVEAVKSLFRILGRVGKMLYDVFAIKSQQDLKDFEETMMDLIGAFEMFFRVVRRFGEFFATVVRQIGRAIDDPETAMKRMLNTVIDLGNGIVEHLVNPLKLFINMWNSIPGLPDIPVLDAVPDAPHLPTGSPGKGGKPMREPGGYEETPFPWLQPHKDREKPGLAPEDWQSAPGTYEIGNIPIGAFPGSEWQMPGMMPGIPGSGAPGTPGATGAPGSYLPPGSGTPHGGQKPGYWEVDPWEVTQAQWRLEDAAQSVEDARKNVLRLRELGATADEINDAQRAVIRAEHSWYESLIALRKAEQGTFQELEDQTKQTGDILGDISASLDNDLGISKGLPGLADNLVRFIATLAAAPVYGALRGTQAALGFPGGEGSGSGLMGMVASSLGWYKGGPYDTSTQGNGNYGPQQFGPMIPGGMIPGVYGPSPGPGGPRYYMTPNGATFGPNGQRTGNMSGWTSALNANGPSKLVDTGTNPSVPNARGAAAFLTQLFPGIPSIGGSNDRPPGTPQMHTMGRALDIMIGEVNEKNQAMGDQINQWLRANADWLGLESTIWRDSWQDFNGNQSIVGGHQNHIHAQFRAGPSLYGGGGGASFFANQGGGGNQNLMAALMQAGIDPAMYPLLQAFAQAEGNNPGGIPTLGFTDAQAGPTLGGHVQALANQLLSRQGVAGPFPYGASPAEQAAWMATVVGQNGVVDWQGNQQPARGDYISSILAGWPQFNSGGAVPIVAHGGEHVLTRGDVKAMGGQRGVYNFRKALHYDLGGEVPFPLGPPGQPPSPPSPPPPGPNKGQGPALPGGVPSPVAIPGYPGRTQITGTQAPTSPGPTQIGGNAPPEGYGPGLSIGGGLVGMLEGAVGSAISAAGMAGDAAGGGGGGSVGAAVANAAIQIGIKEMQRAIEFAGQAAAIGVQGLMETFLPAGASDLANNNWLTRWLGGIAGAAPAIANISGGMLGAIGQKPGNMLLPQQQTPEQIAAAGMDPNRTQHTGTQYAPGPVNINYNVSKQTEDSDGRALKGRLDRLTYEGAGASKGLGP